MDLRREVTPPANVCVFLPAHEAESSAHIHGLMRRVRVVTVELASCRFGERISSQVDPPAPYALFPHNGTTLSFTIRGLDLRLRSYHSCSLDQTGSGMFSWRFPAYRIPHEFVKELYGRHVRIDMDALVDGVIVQDKLQRRWNKAINVFRNGPEV
jgi:hypothetical protein